MSNAITSALGIPLLVPIFGKRRRRDVSHLMKSIQDPLKLQGTNVSPFMKELPLANLPVDLKYISSVFLNPKSKTSSTVHKIWKYMAKKKEKLLKIAVKETEDLIRRPITKELQNQLMHANTNRLLTLLNETLIMQENVHEKATSIGHANYKMLNTNRFYLSPPPRYSPKARKSPLDMPPHPHRSNIRHTLPQTGQEAPPSSADEALVTTKFPKIYRSVCRALTKPGVPHNDIINFIAQRCLLLAYAGMLK